VAEEVERVIERMGKGGGYITAPAQEIQKDVPFGNVCALIDTARRHSGG
jgi:uroporphyrinogen-III decarboxylase